MRLFRKYILLVLCVGIPVVIILFAVHINLSTKYISVTSEYPPMIMHNDKLYMAVCVDEKIVELQSLIQIAEVESCVEGKPQKNNQANSELKGCPIFYSEEFPEYLFIAYEDSLESYKELHTQ